MKGEKTCTGLSNGADCSGYGVGDVVELEVEEDVEAAISQLMDDGVSRGVIELHPNLEPLAGLTEGVDEFECARCIGEIEGYGETGFWRWHVVSLTALLKS